MFVSYKKNYKLFLTKHNTNIVKFFWKDNVIEYL
jgi:hypothetical protein